jgi:hypothetical protein
MRTKTVEICRVARTFCGRPAPVIAPASVVEDAVALLSDLDHPPPVIALEELSPL